MKLMNFYHLIDSKKNLLAIICKSEFFLHHMPLNGNKIIEKVSFTNKIQISQLKFIYYNNYLIRVKYKLCKKEL